MIAFEEVTKKRAFIIFEILKEELLNGGGNEVQSEAFRFVYLILRGARAFLDTFGSGNLYLDSQLISETYFILRFDLPGGKGLSEEEEFLIFTHNKEVKKLIENKSLLY